MDELTKRRIEKRLKPKHCKECEQFYSDAYYEGGHHWHCTACGEITGQQGHYGLLESGWGFSCQQELA